MKIETKLNIGDTVFFIHEKKIIDSVIRSIKTDTFNSAENADKGEILIQTAILYICNKEAGQRMGVKVEEPDAFKSKSELLKSL